MHEDGQHGAEASQVTGAGTGTREEGRRKMEEGKETPSFLFFLLFFLLSFFFLLPFFPALSPPPPV
jgi:hypothetical protein